jgi:hypothetical protein
MEMTVTFSTSSVEVSVEARQRAFQLSDLAMVKRTTALLELGSGGGYRTWPRGWR